MTSRTILLVVATGLILLLAFRFKDVRLTFFSKKRTVVTPEKASEKSGWVDPKTGLSVGDFRVVEPSDSHKKQDEK